MKKQIFEISDILPVYSLFITEDVSGYFYFLRFIIGDDKELKSLIEKYEKLTKIYLSSLKDSKLTFQQKAISLPLVIDRDRDDAIRFFSLKFAVNQYFTECNQIMYPFMQAIFEDEEDIKDYLHDLISNLGFYVNVSPMPNSVLKDYIASYKGGVTETLDFIYHDYDKVLERLKEEEKATIN